MTVIPVTVGGTVALNVRVITMVLPLFVKSVTLGFVPFTVTPIRVKPVKVYPALAVNVTVAVYTVLPRNGLCVGDQTIEVIVKLDAGVAVFTVPVVSGVASITGAVTLTAAAVIDVAVFAN